MSRVFVGCFLLFLLIAPREPWGGAAQLASVSARALAAHGHLDIAAEGPLPMTQVRNGRRFALVPLGPTLTLLPVELPLLLFPKSELGARAARFVEAASAAVLAALTCALFFSALLSLGSSRRTARLLSWGLALATAVLIYARVPDGSALGAGLLLAGFLAARRAVAEPSLRSGLLLGAAAGALALCDRAPAALVLICFSLVFSERRQRLLWSLLPLACGLFLMVLQRKLIGAAPEAHGDLLEGLDGLLLSTGKSLFASARRWCWRCPPCARWKTHRTDAVLVIALLCAVLVPVASLERWDGDPAWGPRRVAPLVPLLLLPVGPWLEAAWQGWRRAGRAGVIGLFAVGLYVQILGAAFPPDRWLAITTAVKNSTGAAGWFVTPEQAHFMPQFSPLVGHHWLLSNLLRREKKLEKPPWVLLAPGAVKLDAEWQRVRLDWWALALRHDTVPQ